MTYWIIPADPNRYRLIDFFSAHKLVDWTQHNNFENGDIVFIYTSRPYSQILYKTEVTDVGLPYDATIDDKEYWVNPKDAKPSLHHNNFFRMRLLAENTTDKLKFEDLLEHGLKGAPRGAVKIKEPLLTYIQQIF